MTEYSNLSESSPFIYGSMNDETVSRVQMRNAYVIRLESATYKKLVTKRFEQTLNK